MKEMELLGPDVEEPGLDYIIKDPVQKTCFFKNSETGDIIHNYGEELKTNILTVKLKNAIMVKWL